jgi:hypothetical protein
MLDSNSDGILRSYNMLASGSPTTSTNQIRTPRWNPPTAYTTTFGHHAPLLNNQLRPSGTDGLPSPSNAPGEHSPHRSRNFRQLRPWTSNVFDCPAAYGSRYFASTLLTRRVGSYATGSVRGASPPPASPADLASPPLSPAASGTPAPSGGAGTALAALRARFRPGGPRARFDAEFYHRDPIYTRDPGAETRFSRSDPRERQLCALFSSPSPPLPPSRSSGGASAGGSRPPSAAAGASADGSRPPSAAAGASGRPAAAGTGGRIGRGLGLRSWQSTGPGASMGRSWSP